MEPVEAFVVAEDKLTEFTDTALEPELKASTPADVGAPSLPTGYTFVIGRAVVLFATVAFVPGTLSDDGVIIKLGVAPCLEATATTGEPLFGVTVAINK